MATVLLGQGIGLKAGLNITNVSGDLDETQGRIAYQVGGVVESGLTDNLFINFGLIYSLKGFKYEFFGSTTTENYHYLEVPINLAYKFDLKVVKLIIEGGPYVGFMPVANLKSDGEVIDIQLGDEPDEVSPIDYGIGIGIGLAVHKFQFMLTNQFGIRDIDNADNFVVRNRVATLSAAYYFMR